MNKNARRAVFIMFVLLAFVLSACEIPASGNAAGGVTNEVNEISDTDAMVENVSNTETSESGDVDLDENGMMKISITIGDKVFDAKLYDNESVRAIVSEMPFTLAMNDFASQEKVTKLTFALPSATTETPDTINAGDIYLWSGNSLVLFYTTFSNSYSYVPVGYIVDVTGLTGALGKGNVSVTFRKVLRQAIEPSSASCKKWR